MILAACLGGFFKLLSLIFIGTKLVLGSKGFSNVTNCTKNFILGFVPHPQ